jgi:uncharacterized membrane protein YqiK
MEAFLQMEGGILGGILGVAAFFLFTALLKSMIQVNLPNQLLVVTGRKKKREGKTFGFSVERGRTLRIPYLQTVSDLDLGVFPVNVRVEGVNSANGITLGADATACVCVDDDEEAMLYSAVERLMGKDRAQVQAQIQQTLVGNFRGALNKATPLQAIGMEESWNGEDAEAPETIQQGERAQFRNELLADINSDISSFGMKVVSVSFQKIWDTSNYIANLAQKTLAQKRQDVEIEEARLRALAEKAESDAERRIEVAKNQAEEKILAAREKLEVYRRESTGMIRQAKLEADNSIKESQNRGENDVQAQLVELQKLRNRSRLTMEAEAKEKASQILAQGEEGAINIKEQTRNEILKQKVEMLSQAGETGKTILFIQQQLPSLFDSFRKYAQGLKVDSLIIMDEEKGFNGAVNRGPSAFADFLKQFENALGVDVKNFLTKQPLKEASK